MANRTTYTQARARLASLCDQVAESREPYVIERRNSENVVLMSEAELDSLLETAHLLRSPDERQKLLEADGEAVRLRLLQEGLEGVEARARSTGGNGHGSKLG